MTKLYLVRHGETDWNVARRIQGSTDIPLNDTGRLQAGRAGRLLATRHWDAIVSSPLSRAMETATIVAGELGIGMPEARADLVERSYGLAEGLDHATLSRRFPHGSEVPGRESREQVEDRVIPALIDIARARPGQSVVVVTHGGVIRTVVNAVEPDDPAFLAIPITNGSIHSFEYIDGGLSLIAFDDQLEFESIDPDADDFVAQNALAAREVLAGRVRPTDASHDRRRGGKV